MKCAIVLLALGALVGAQQADNQKPLIERVDVEAVLKNERIFLNYLKCVMDEGPCTPEGRDLKKSIITFREEQKICPKCSDKEKLYLHKILIKLRDNYADQYKKVIAKYAGEKELHDLVQKFIKNGP